MSHNYSLSISNIIVDTEGFKIKGMHQNRNHKASRRSPSRDFLAKSPRLTTSSNFSELADQKSPTKLVAEFLFCSRESRKNLSKRPKIKVFSRLKVRSYETHSIRNLAFRVITRGGFRDEILVSGNENLENVQEWSSQSKISAQKRQSGEMDFVDWPCGCDFDASP